MHRNRLTILAVTGLLLLACPGKNKPDTPLTPWLDVVGDSLAFFTTSVDPQGGQLAYVFDWGYSHYDTTGWYDSGDTAWACHEFHIARACNVRARAFNAEGRWSDWSAPMEYLPSGPPALADTFFGPWWWGRDRWARYSATVSDPDGDSVYVRFDWGDGRRSAWLGPVPSGATVTDSVLWPADSLYRVSVTLRDQRGTITPAAGTRLVKVSLMAVLWHHYDDYCGTVSPTLRLDGSSFQVIVNNNYESLFCYRPDGSVKWMAGFDVCQDYAPALSPDGSRLYATAYVQREDFALSCFDAETGRMVWSCLDVNFCGTPALGPDGAIYIYDRVRQELLRMADDGDSCRIVWSVPLQADTRYSYSYPALGSDGTVYLTYQPNGRDSTALAAVAPDGSVLWSRKFNRYTESDMVPMIDPNGRIILVDYTDGVFCVNPDGSLAWRQPGVVESYPFKAAIGPDSRVYLSTENYSLYCIEPTAGTVAWRANLNSLEIEGTPIVLDDGRVLVSSSTDEEARLTAFDPDGRELWQFAAVESLGLYKSAPRRRRDEYDASGTPIVGPDGNLYVGDDYLGLWCLSFGNARIASGGWPTYNHDQSRSGWAGGR